jgi:hypothetical protein
MIGEEELANRFTHHLEDAVMWANAAIARDELWPIMTPPRSGGS